jgi:phosphoglucomutase
MTHPRAGQPAEAQDLVDVEPHRRADEDRQPDLDDPHPQVAVGT